MRDMLPSFTTSPAISPFSFDRLNRTPYLLQWSFGLQKSLGSNWVIEAEYAGSQGNKLPQRRNMNAGAVDPTGTIPIAQRVPFPGFGPGMLLTYNGGWSSYNALTAKIERRFAEGLYLLGSYTWQKSLDLGATDEFSTISTEYKKWDKGHSTFDVPHRFVASFTYELPFGRGTQVLERHQPRRDFLLGGWQTSGILTFSQGQFQTLNLGSDWILVGSFSRSIPQVVGDPFAGNVGTRPLLESRGVRFPARRARQSASRRGQCRTQHVPAARHQQLGYELVQELPHDGEVQHAVPLGDIQHAEPHPVRQRQHEHAESDVRSHHQHAHHSAAHAARPEGDLVAANGKAPRRHLIYWLSNMMYRRILLTSAFALGLVQAQTDWPVFGHDPGAMRFSPLKQVNTGNIAGFSARGRSIRANQARKASRLSWAA